MMLRPFTHALILALFLTAGVLAAYVSPATAGMARDAAGVEQTMEAGMPCCPSDQDGPKDCTTNCPALTFCLAKCFASRSVKFVALPRSVMAVVSLMGDDAERASHTFAPPARPPRS
ncbi:hypothetical protein [Bosea vaviloviae]|uniref:hypothetical protein n=1 Tax=Bosea vaviloviae TaxID=1526658 RepID=UPI0006BB1A52|nr:hypothetical protein [Bosea vaviloviae]